MIKLKTEDEINIIKNNSIILSNALAHVATILKPGITTNYVNNEVQKFILQHNAVPSFKGYEGFPFAICASVNDVVVHGFPNDEPLQEGDVVSIDAGVYKDGYHSDSAYTYIINGHVSKDIIRLVRMTKQSLYLGIEQAIEGNRIGNIGFAIQNLCENQEKLGVVRDLVGHGLGKKLHESPSVPNYGKSGSGKKLQTGLVIAIEPMITLGTYKIYVDKDNWTIRTKDNSVAAHFEHTVCIDKQKAQILSNFLVIEDQEKKNKNLLSM
ncbi:MAG: type I methionyl aminopeptidase [Chitinophagaceae bacterium]